MCDKNKCEKHKCTSCGKYRGFNDSDHTVKVGDFVKRPGWNRWYEIITIENQQMIVLKNKCGQPFRYRLDEPFWIFKRVTNHDTLLERLYDAGFSFDAAAPAKIDCRDEKSKYFNCRVIDLDDQRNLGFLIETVRDNTNEDYVCEMVVGEKQLTCRVVATWYACWAEVQKTEIEDEIKKISDQVDQSHIHIQLIREQSRISIRDIRDKFCRDWENHCKSVEQELKLINELHNKLKKYSNNK